MITVQTKLSEREISELERILKDISRKDISKGTKEVSWKTLEHKKRVEGFIVNEQGKYFRINATLEGQAYNVTLEIDIENKNYPVILEECRRQLGSFYDIIIRHTAN